MSSPVDEAGGDRLEALEQQVRQLTSRLAGWVEAQLVQALDDRRTDMQALRSELQTDVADQLAGVRAEFASVLSVATRRLEVAQEQLGERVDAVVARAADTAANALAVTGASVADAERLEILEEYVGERLAVLREQFRAELATFGEEQARVLDSVWADVREGPVGVEGLEQRVKAAMGRLTEGVEARLAETAGTGTAALEAVRAELAGRLDAMGREADLATAVVGAVQQSVADSAELTAALDRQVTSAIGRLGDAFEVRLVQLAAAHAGDVSTLRNEWTATSAAMGQQLDELATRAGALTDDVAMLRVEAGAGDSRTEELEQRVKAAVARLAESVEGRLSELAVARGAELGAAGAALRGAMAAQATELRAELDTATSAMRSRFAHALERLDVVERRHTDGDDRVTELVEARLVELRRELEASLASQLLAGRTEIGTVVADAHRRFVSSVDRLEERMDEVAERASGAWAAAASLDVVQETVASDGRRIEALEVHTRRTDTRLGEVVEAKLAEVGGPKPGELDGWRAEFRAAVESVRGHLRTALDAHLAETREEVTLALGQSRSDLVAGATQLDALVESVERTVREAEAVAAQVAGADVARGAGASDAVAALGRKLAKAQVQAELKLADMAAQLDTVVSAASKEAGALAPVRSDVRQLQAQVAELAEVVAELRPKRKATPSTKVAPSKKVAVPAPAPRRRTAQ